MMELKAFSSGLEDYVLKALEAEVGHLREAYIKKAVEDYEKHLRQAVGRVAIGLAKYFSVATMGDHIEIHCKIDKNEYSKSSGSFPST